MEDEKVYRPATIEEQPFPGLTEAGFVNDTQSTTTKTVNTPKTIKDYPLPQKIISHETIGQSLNTKARKILQEYQFTESGALAIGKFLEAISGDIRITPDGLVARDSSGNITFALDGQTGNAVFAGQLRSGSVITGKIEMGPDGYIAIGDENGGTIVDQYGIVSTNNFPIHSLSQTPFTSFTNTTYQDLGSSYIDLTVRRDVLALVTLSALGSSEQINAALNCSGTTYYRIKDEDANGNESTAIELYYDSFIDTASGARENIISKPYVLTKGYLITAGQHALTLQGKIANNTNFRSVINNYSMSVIVLGA